MRTRILPASVATSTLAFSLALIVAPGGAAADPITLTGPGIDAKARSGDVTVMFNPKEYTITKATPWKHHDIQGLDAPTLEFTSGEPYRCQFELFFDRYEEGKSVREITDKIERLAIAEIDTGRPPIVTIKWGGDLFGSRLLGARTQVLAVDRQGLPTAARMQTLWSAPIPIDKARPPGKADAVPARIQFGGDIASVTLDASEAFAFLGTSQGSAFIDTVPLDAGTLRELLSTLKSPRVRLHRVAVPLLFDTSASGNDVSDLVQDLLDAAGAPDCAGNRKPLLLEIDGKVVVRGTLSATSLRYTMFLPSGTPVRAVMNTVWKEFSPAEEQLKGNPRH